MSNTKSDRDINNLEPQFRQKVELRLKEVGDQIFITEGYRTQARQKYLYSIGRTLPGKKVTWTLSSNHTKGLAVDIAFKGDKLYPSKTSIVWRNLANSAKKYGINWGGDWEEKKDYPHFEDNGEPLSTINIIMGYYQEVRNKECKDIPTKERVFEDPKGAYERLKNMTQTEQLEEVLYLLGLLVQRAKKQ